MISGKKQRAGVGNRGGKYLGSSGESIVVPGDYQCRSGYHEASPVESAAPIAPEQRCRADAKRMQQDADLERLGGRAAIPLTLLAQRTRAAVANAGRIHQAQAAVGFSTPLLGMKRLSCGTTERSVRLERKVLTRKAPRFPGGGRGRRAIPRCGGGGGGSLLTRLRFDRADFRFACRA